MTKRILVVDDEPAVREVVLFKLQLEGYVTDSASDGTGALEAVARNRPDLIILDLSMPKMDGYAVCARLQEDPLTASIPIIIFTARSQPADRARAAEFPIRDFVLKPFSPRDLSERIKRILVDD